jgi:hypothetical protein
MLAFGDGGAEHVGGGVSRSRQTQDVQGTRIAQSRIGAQEPGRLLPCGPLERGEYRGQCVKRMVARELPAWIQTCLG